MMRRIIRTGLELVVERSGLFSRDLYPCYEVFSRYYPIQAPQMKQALHYAINPLTDKAQLLAFVYDFGSWLTAEIARLYPELM